MMYLLLHIQWKNTTLEFCSAKWPGLRPKALEQVNLPHVAAPAVPAESGALPAGRVTGRDPRAGGATADHRRGRKCPKMLRQAGGCREAPIPSPLPEAWPQPATSRAQGWGASRAVGVRRGETRLCTTSPQQTAQLQGVEWEQGRGSGSITRIGNITRIGAKKKENRGSWR